MKIMTFQAGLGNQIFQYVYYQYLRKHFPRQKFYGFYPERGLKSHNGLEIDKWFEIDLPKNTFKSDLIAKILFWTNKFFCKIQQPHPYTDTDWYRKPDALFYYGFWQDKKYYLEVGTPPFRNNLTYGDNNEYFLKLISEVTSVAVHVRRGDYKDPKVQFIYGNICTIDYYYRAINEIKKRIKKPIFFFFSDEPNYIEQNFKDIDKITVNCNKGERSFFDLYLMAHCKHMILANSTFSCWAAYLNINKPLVICPQKWRNDKPSPPIILDQWIKL